MKTTLLSFFLVLNLYSINISSQCSISNIQLTPILCDGTSEYYYILDFDYQNVGTMGYGISSSYLVNAPYDYANLPDTIGPYPSLCNQSMDFVIYDVEYGFGCSDIIIPYMECCNPTGAISNLSAIPTCNADDSFTLTIDFDYNNPGSSSFDLYIQRNGYQAIGSGEYSYSSLPLTITNPTLVGNCTDVYKIIVFDSQDLTSTDATDEFVVCCMNECYIDGVILDYDCNANVLSNLFITPIGIDLGDEGFVVYIDGIEYQDPSTTVSILNINYTDPIIEYTICSQEFPGCCYTGDFENPCFNAPNCEITYFEAYVDGMCDSLSNIPVSFAYQNVNEGNFGFNISLNNMLLDTYAYGDNVTIDIPGECGELYTFVMQDVEFPDCSASFTLDSLCCGMNPPSCVINEVILDYDCVGNVMSNFFLTPIGNNLGDSGFIVVIDSVTYLDTNSTVSILGINYTGQNLSYTICSQAFPDCCYNGVFVNPCITAPNCEITYFEAYADGMCDSLGNIPVSFAYQNVNEGSLGFNISLNNMLLDTYAYGDNVTIDIPGECGELYTFVMQDVEFPDCSASFTLDSLCCGMNPPSCVINEVILDYDCVGNVMSNFFLTPIGNNLGDSGFIVVIDSVTYQDTNSYVSIIGINFVGQYLSYTICSQTNPSCCYSSVFENPCYVATDCEITYFQAYEDGDCDSLGNIPVSFAYQNVNEGSLGFSILQDSTFLGSFAYGDVVTINVPAACNEIYQFVMQDNEFPNCTASYTLDSLCCGVNPPQCMINEVILDYDCVGNVMSNFFLTPIGNNLGDSGFIVVIDSVTYQDTNSYVSIIGINFVGQYLSYTICSQTNPSCCYSSVFENPCYVATDCEITYFQAYEDGDCDSLGNIPVSFAYQNVNEGSLGFSILQDSTFLGSFAYGDVVTINVPAACNEIYQFVMQDNEFPNCTASYTLDSLCCGMNPLECTINEVNYTLTFDGLLLLTLEINSNGQCSGMYRILLNGELLGDYEVIDGMITLPIENYNPAVFLLTICPTDHLENCMEISIANLFSTSIDLTSDFVKLVLSADRKLQLQKLEASEMNFNIFSTEGKKISSFATSANQLNYELDLKTIPNGMYFIQCQMKGRNKAYKVILVD